MVLTKTVVNFFFFIFLFAFSDFAAAKKKKKKKKQKQKSKKMENKYSDNDSKKHAAPPPPTAKCLACEDFGRKVAHANVRKQLKELPHTIEEWKSNVATMCDHDGCGDWLTSYETDVIAAELKEIHEEGDDATEMDAYYYQALLCFDLTEACPTGQRGTTKHRFQPVGKAADAVQVTFVSRLPKPHMVDVHWVDPNQEMTPGGNLARMEHMEALRRNSYRGHRFRFVRPKEEFQTKGPSGGVRAEVTLSSELEQRYEIFLNSSFIEDMPDRLPDPSATQPDDWDEAEDGPWSPPTIPNPDSARNNLYWVKKLEDGENFGDPPFRTLDEHTSTLDPSTVKDTAMAANQRISVGYSDL
jgi:hypothetical protein